MKAQIQEEVKDIDREFYQNHEQRIVNINSAKTSDVGNQITNIAQEIIEDAFNID